MRDRSFKAITVYSVNRFINPRIPTIMEDKRINEIEHRNNNFDDSPH
mgnify:CR=1 FL=1